MVQFQEGYLLFVQTLHHRKQNQHETVLFRHLSISFIAIIISYHYENINLILIVKRNYSNESISEGDM